MAIVDVERKQEGEGKLVNVEREREGKGEHCIVKARAQPCIQHQNINIVALTHYISKST